MSAVVYPTQAKSGLEWGTQLLLPVQRKFEVRHDAAVFTPTPGTGSKGWVPHSSPDLAWQ